MNQKTVYQYDLAGNFVGPTMADESPMEPGVWIMPARTVEAVPPSGFAADLWPRWDGSAWHLSTKPQADNDNDPVAKLRDFLAANPDVAAILK